MNYIPKGKDMYNEHFRLVLSNEQGDKQFHASIGYHLLNMDIGWPLKQSSIIMDSWKLILHLSRS